MAKKKEESLNKDEVVVEVEETPVEEPEVEVQHAPATDEQDEELIVDEVPPAKPEPPLNDHEKRELADLERRSLMGRKIDQPTMREMERLGILRRRSKV